MLPWYLSYWAITQCLCGFRSMECKQWYLWEHRHFLLHKLSKLWGPKGNLSNLFPSLQSRRVSTMRLRGGKRLKHTVFFMFLQGPYFECRQRWTESSCWFCSQGHGSPFATPSLFHLEASILAIYHSDYWVSPQQYLSYSCCIARSQS